MYIKKILLIIVLLGVVVGGFITYRIYTAIFDPNTAFNNKEAYVIIPTGASFQEVRTQLAPLLKDIDAFESVAQRKGYNTNVKAGRYAIKKGMNNNDIVNTLRVNNLPIRLTFNNQETLPRLAGRIASQIEADSLALLRAFEDEDFFKESGFNRGTAIGMYIPNSYEFFWNTSAVDFRDRMFKEHRRFWNEGRKAKAKALNLSANEVMTVASIVQKETAKVDERPRVAGVYLNRIRRKMPLQADPTVIFAIKEKYNNHDTVIKRVLYRDLEIDSKYNTYKYASIPPGPIAMPDVSAIDAVLNAENHDYLFFVADVKRPGYHMFAKTLTQHNRNKNQYRRWIDQQGIYR